MTEIIQIKCGMVNCYLLKGDGGAVLVDTAVPRYKKMLLERVKGVPLTLIFLTHGHADHIGNAMFLAENTGAKIAINESDADLIARPHGHAAQASTFLGKLIKGGNDASLYKPEPFVPDIYFAGGERLDAYGVDAQAAALPGHTAGSMGIFVNRQDFIVGDAMFHVLNPSGPLTYEDKPAAADTLKKIRLCRPRVIYPGHGKPFEGAFVTMISPPETYAED